MAQKWSEIETSSSETFSFSLDFQGLTFTFFQISYFKNMGSDCKRD